MRSILLCVLLFVGLGQASVSLADNSGELPHEILEVLTEELVDGIIEAKTYFAREPERFYTKVDGLLEPVVDYTTFSRAVMGSRGSSKYYKSLASEAERQAYRDQVRRFAGAVRARMVTTLSKGVMTFSDERIEVVPPDPKALERIRALKSVTITQLIYRTSEAPLRVEYKLKPNRSGDWKMINVVIGNVNLGKQYRSEFSSKLKEYGGDINQVIEYWAQS